MAHNGQRKETVSSSILIRKEAMGKKILIAEPREVIRTGLCTVFQKDTSVSEVKDISTGEELKKHLSSLDFDLAVVSQTLITDLKLLPQGKFILLTDEPDLNILMAAYEDN